ncbi:MULTISPECIES: biotin/lipoyl-containing protein [Breznakia]|uniref:Biotin carboxyl carrier protein of acetyl-CoA carboxylase n=1 Tax=Breznakia blatticola TaxID=1754012 RepID=A0A4R7ZB75_9FIRM|nr:MULTISPECIES: biotin/lipoyl-containing protein [Breznakia]MDH6365867.1 acetyl-CoA carboxylase biotin carboxyl carrier protein [Breznakia sp. PH1-1]MDH6403201.1 acetyl-CoA carboxylase biotin carboxyl carrier protein [Breznakia sp. PF1-11]MDH6410910.1 acetyl-CoA carboxylase biotin carboxyl carrier protein [Breznakia sp. PFB1-11]MDH6413033.1 acetyl-CoA carboxylase biotin carboxyl carrier protein [Breznakia sp. PFB1-14]MDH6415401.1 acetyl-CoA carboxylase biotin carboxyl carrier protein [Breznak
MDTSKIKAIIALFEDSSLAKMELEVDDIKIAMEKPGASVEYISTPAPVSVSAPVASVTEESTNQVTGTDIKSPLVGTYYAAPSENDAPFVEVGSQVKAGDTLCIIEAMKVLNEIKAPQAGRVAWIAKNNGDMVQFDDVLMIID